VNRKSLLTLVVGVLLVVGVFPLAGCHRSGDEVTDNPTALTAAMQPPTVGQSVAAAWTNQDYYLAKVTKVNDDQITVQFADGLNSSTIDASEVRLIPNHNWSVGDKVMAAGTSGEFSPGTITDADTDVGSYVVKFDDGNQNATVTDDKIMSR
jgi:hypothetical protein